ncbi:MAG TPA: winged helix DNA-binding domain-containing protein, partial [Actinomycetota bacterium]|nr:winged helix DNA-binding domain-containing protein [Actinomycetota bacterium]
TLHTVTARDARAVRPLMQPLVERVAWSQKGVRAAGLDDEERDELLGTFRSLLEERPRTRAELADAIRDRYPGRDATALSLVMYVLPTVQVTPRGVWGRTGPSAFTTLERWLGRARVATATVEELVLRYLAVFGPATHLDAQTWSGLQGLRSIFEGLRPRLRTFVAEDGHELFDIAAGEFRDPDTPAPIRFLPEYDNALIGFADRGRVFGDRVPQWTAVGWGPVLVDGVGAARWRLLEDPAGATMRIETFGRLSASSKDDVLAEGARLARFLLDGREDAAIRLGTYAA